MLTNKVRWLPCPCIWQNINWTANHVIVHQLYFSLKRLFVLNTNIISAKFQRPVHLLVESSYLLLFYTSINLRMNNVERATNYNHIKCPQLTASIENSVILWKMQEAEVSQNCILRPSTLFCIFELPYETRCFIKHL